MRFGLYLTLLLAIVPIIFLRPFFGLCVYYVVSLMQPKVLCWRPDFQDALLVGAPMVIGAIAFGVHRWIIEPQTTPGGRRVIGVRRRRVRSPLLEPSWLLVVLGLLVAYVAVNRYVAAVAPDQSADAFSRLCKMALVTALLTGLASDLRRFRILYIVVALSAAFWAVKGGLYVLLLGLHQVFGRNYDNNHFALTTVMVLPMVFYFGMSLQRSRWRWILLALSALMCLGIIGSQSRAGFLALVVVLFCLAWTSRHRVKAMAGVALLTLVAVVSSWQEIRTRVDSIWHYPDDPSARARFVIWDSASRMISDYPLFGVGFANFERVCEAMNAGRRAPHNIWLSALAELGLLGYPLWLAFILGGAALAYRLTRLGRRGPPDTRWCYYWARGLLLGMVAYMVHGHFHNEDYLDLMFAMIGMTVALRATLRRELATRRVLAAVESGQMLPPTAVLRPEPAGPARWSPWTTQLPALENLPAGRRL